MGGDAALSAACQTALLTTFAEARDLGFLGPGPVAAHIDHSLGFAHAIGAWVEGAGNLADLGSGGGVPGLVLACLWPAVQVVLLDANARRTSFLERVAGELHLPLAPQIVRGRAEELGRDLAWRCQFDIVVARSFASPAVTAECAAPLLRVGGHLVVSEPPDATDRWPDAGLTALGLEVETLVQDQASFQVLRQRHRCPDEFPRPVGRPSKRPLF